MSECRWCDEGRPFMPGTDDTQHMPLFGGDGEHQSTMCHNSPIYKKHPVTTCPKCGAEPTHQTPDGTYWDSQAHYWR